MLGSSAPAEPTDSKPPEVHMTRTVVRAGIAAMVLASAVIAGGGPTAQAQARPAAIPSEYIFTYYSNAQHSAEIGQRFVGNCDLSYLNWGNTSSYYTYSGYSCTVT
jgi:hypothetical protein